jgi:ADP-L-glycero-D-manno-heptose 6-epimerase
VILVTGGAGFIGSNLVRALWARGERDLLVVDKLREHPALANLGGCEVATMDAETLSAALDAAAPKLDGIRVIFHQGACTDTTADERTVMIDNYGYSMRLLAHCRRTRTRLIYASSAAVYGASVGAKGEERAERPLNPYARSKLLVDDEVRRCQSDLPHQTVGLRYFNVYGPRESHKNRMASMAWQLRSQLDRTGRARLFRGTDGLGDGEQRRDFVYVDDVVDVLLWFWDHPQASGIFDVGTGHARSFNDLARALIRHRGRGEIEYVPFPDELRGRYQSHTEASLDGLRAVGCQVHFRSLEEGVARYMAWIDGNSVTSGGDP